MSVLTVVQQQQQQQQQQREHRLRASVGAAMGFFFAAGCCGPLGWVLRRAVSSRIVMAFAASSAAVIPPHTRAQWRCDFPHPLKLKHRNHSENVSDEVHFPLAPGISWLEFFER